jgi:Tol biopolymer transport system component
MTQRHDLDRMLAGWLDDPYTPPAPHYLGQVLEQTRRTRQRPAWTNLERWIPMADRIPRPATAGPTRLVWFTIVALLVIALAAGAAFVGSRLLRGPSDRLESSVAIPRGAAAVLAYGSFVGDSNGQTGGDIYLVHADGTEQRQVTDEPGIASYPMWSPDGTRIAYLLLGAGNESLVLMDAGGRNRTTLFTTPQATLNCVRGGPAWSPDGAYLLFQVSQPCNGTSPYDLFVVPADGSSPATRLLTAEAHGVFGAWSPDGQHIAFMGSGATDDTSLQVVDLVSGRVPAGGLEGRTIGPGDGLILDVLTGPQWSPDGSELAASAGGRVIASKADGSGQRTVTEQGINPTWSRDGKQMAFYRTVDPSEYFQDRPCTVRIWIVDADGTNERRLEQLGDGCGPGPAWSPDGTRIAGISIGTVPYDSTVGFHVGIVPVDGSSQTVMLLDGGVGSWQPVAAPLPAPSIPPASTAP